jgi:hypothetical protein
VSDVTALAQGNGIDDFAIFLIGSGTGVTLQRVTALAEGASRYNFALFSREGAVTTLLGGSFTGRGGETTTGINNQGSAMLEIEGVTVLGENGSVRNIGLNNTGPAVLHGSSFTARGGTTSAHGIINQGSAATLETRDVTALAEDCSGPNNGLTNTTGATATLQGGSFTAHGGSEAWGVSNYTATLEAQGITAMGSNGTSNYGVSNGDTSTAKIDSSRLIGSTSGLHQPGGTVYLGITQLDGGASKSGGTLACFQVYNGSYGAYSCPP